MAAGPFSSIPVDVFSHITHFLSLESITRLSQVRLITYIISRTHHIALRCAGRFRIAFSRTNVSGFIVFGWT